MQGSTPFAEPATHGRVLRPGHNCWKVAHAGRFALLVDGSDYYGALRAALIQAQRTIFILGWDIDSRVQLLPGGAHDGFPDPFGDFLNALVAQRANLHAYVLSWDFAMLYALEREWLPLYKLDWRTHRRLKFRLDGRHPTGGSHHQKIVVIDDTLAFCGGLDITQRRWDTPEHLAHDPRRVDPSGAPYGPFHDVQAMVDGDAAYALGELARARWRRATGENIALTPALADHDPWPKPWQPGLCDLELGISRTLPRLENEPAVEEIRELHVDLIAAATRFIYAETQYLSSIVIADAHAQRLVGDTCPEIVLVSHRVQDGWLEQASMGILRARLHRRLHALDARRRFRLYCADVMDLPGGCLMVHSKIMVVDDELLTVGSANLNNRSMGYDSECNLTLEAAGDHRISASIARMRNTLLAEHLGADGATLEERIEHGGSLIHAIENSPSRRRVLREANLEPPTDLENVGLDQALFDPERPVPPEILIRDFLPRDAKRITTTGVLKLAAALSLLGALAAIWQWTPLRDSFDLAELVEQASALRDFTWAPVAVPLLFVLCGLLLVPVTVLIAATGVIFGPLAGTAYALTGAAASAATTYWLGRALGKDVVRRFAGHRVNRLTQRLARRGLIAMSIVRLLPIAPFSFVNVVAGASRIGFRDFMLGTLVGMTPGITAAVVFADRFAAAFVDPSLETFAAAAGVVMTVVGLALALERALNRPRQALDSQN